MDVIKQVYATWYSYDKVTKSKTDIGPLMFDQRMGAYAWLASPVQQCGSGIARGNTLRSNGNIGVCAGQSDNSLGARPAL